MRGTVKSKRPVPELHRLDRRVPSVHRHTLAGSAVSQRVLARRIAELGREMAADYAGTEVVIVALLNGSVLFVADLVRQWTGPMKLDFIGVSSYRGGLSSGRLVHTKDLRLDVRGREVLVVDDILDTGRTLEAVRRRLGALGARRVRICVLLDKPAGRISPVQADYVGFRIPDWFVVGYGLDFEEHWRNLPFIGVLHPELESRTGRQRPKAKPAPVLS